MQFLNANLIEGKGDDSRTTTLDELRYHEVITTPATTDQIAGHIRLFSAWRTPTGDVVREWRSPDSLDGTWRRYSQSLSSS